MVGIEVEAAGSKLHQLMRSRASLVALRLNSGRPYGVTSSLINSPKIFSPYAVNGVLPRFRLSGHKLRQRLTQQYCPVL